MTRREIPLDARRILESLAEFGVDYTLIGGLAVQAHGHTRTTQDVDLVAAQDEGNRSRLLAALESLGARPAGHPHDVRPAALELPAGGVAVLDTDAGGVDVHVAPPGAPPYEELRRRALVIDLGGLEVPVAGRDDLIAMKLAAARPIDRSDVLALTEPEQTEAQRGLHGAG